MKAFMNIKNKWWLLIAVFAASCKKDSTDGFLSPALKYTNPSIKVAVGASLIQSGAMVTDESTKPLTFSIDGIYYEDGKLADKVMAYKVDTYFWQAEYTGKEKTVEELNQKRTKVNRPAIDINPENGNIVIYPEASDTTQLVKGKYIIDVRVKNSGGEIVVKKALTIDVSYALPYYYRFAGVDGNLTGIDVTFDRQQPTGNKILVYVLKKDGSPVDPKLLLGYDYSSTPGVTDLKDWHSLGLNNPTKYTEFPDHLELEIAGYPLPFVAGQVLRIDMYNNGEVNGQYFNYWFDMAILKEGIWKVTIKLKYN
ncbi:DUF5007 domain-containing protein [Chitinophaga polysaccharea]|uniref:DUF5007 domain-containing protein n=1 Tax=Chitinophaga TaxID=79328 RepID=UPI0014558EA3|nr:MULTISPECIES: DUF5007 domain-containing protein [Chitinophaga]NLR59434.1 DUF5007 domain-containing protein [Chitinophaga polysaccharea]NLU96068.1 DUF5007 domain-containing protein [Chitinophaga sp. Ak27]